MKRLLIDALLLLGFVMSSAVTAAAEEQLHLLSRSNSGNLEKYHSYVNTAVLRFKIPQDISFVSFKFIADEISKNLFDCYAHNVSLFLTRGAPPVINPDGSKFPTNFMLQSKPEIYEILFKSDNQPKYINLTSPYPGLYYAATFNPYTNPRDEGITQHGLSAECTSTVDAYLYARLHATQFIKDHLNTSVNVTTNSPTAIYKLITPDGVDHILITVRTIQLCPKCAGLLIKVGRGNVQMENVTFIVGSRGKRNIQLWVKENEWYYITYEMGRVIHSDEVKNTEVPLTNNKTNQFISFHFTITYFSSLQNTSKFSTNQFAFKSTSLNELNANLTQSTPVQYDTSTNSTPFEASTKLYRSPNDLTLLPYKEYPLIKGSKADSFLYTFDLHPDETGNRINLTEHAGAVLTFDLQDGLDVGGTLQFILAIKPTYRGGVRNGGGRRVRLPTANHTILACISPHTRLIPIYPNLCYDNLATLSQPFNNTTPTIEAIVLNRTSTDDSVQIPFPEAGPWYLTLHMYCNSTCTKCDCSDECKGKYQDCVEACEMEQEGFGSENDIRDCTFLCRELTLAAPTCASCDCIAGCLRRRPVDSNDPTKAIITETCNSSVLFDISSYPCVQSGCGNNGKCVYMLSEGFVYSSCSCRNNYRGWDCMDESEASSFYQIVLELLLLVISNIMFLPAAFFAYKRRYYVEMVVYLSTCFFSSFYHYCDAGENIVSVCILPLYALQFCDFYCGLMGIWVTLVAMAHIPVPWPSIAHMLGAVILGCGTTYDKQSIWVFVLPAAAGCLLILSTWSVRFFRTRRKFPSRKYLSLFLPAGLVIVALALIMYATLQTKNNYKYVHSAWHILMAIGVIILLPDETTFVSVT